MGINRSRIQRNTNTRLGADGRSAHPAQQQTAIQAQGVGNAQRRGYRFGVPSDYSNCPYPWTPDCPPFLTCYEWDYVEGHDILDQPTGCKTGGGASTGLVKEFTSDSGIPGQYGGGRGFRRSFRTNIPQRGARASGRNQATMQRFANTRTGPGGTSPKSMPTTPCPKGMSWQLRGWPPQWVCDYRKLAGVGHGQSPQDTGVNRARMSRFSNVRRR